MKKQFLIGLATAMALTTFNTALAAPMRSGELRSRIEREQKDALKKGSITGLNEANAERARQSAADKLTSIARIADLNEMTAAAGKKIKVKEADGKEVEMNMMDIMRKTLMVEQSIKSINRNELDAEARAHLEKVEQALEVSAQFLAMANKTSDVSTNINALTQKQVDAFNKQLSLIPELLTRMDTRELESHVEIMRAAIGERVSPNIKGDQAYANALKKKYGEKAEAKLDEILGCAR